MLAQEAVAVAVEAGREGLDRVLDCGWGRKKGTVG